MPSGSSWSRTLANRRSLDRYRHRPCVSVTSSLALSIWAALIPAACWCWQSCDDPYGASVPRFDAIRHGRRSEGRDRGTGDVEAGDVASAARVGRGPDFVRAVLALSPLHQPHCGTGIRPDRDIAARQSDIKTSRRLCRRGRQAIRANPRGKPGSRPSKAAAARETHTKRRIRSGRATPRRILSGSLRAGRCREITVRVYRCELSLVNHGKS
jgi:hypothetical protein